jgi:hypothetical protein
VIPHYRLSTPLTRAWAINREARHKLAAWLADKYPRTGAAVVTDRLFVVAWVNPLGTIKFAAPPFQKVERHQCANNPTWRECECRRWFDPEIGGPWGRRQTPRHHPLCIFDENALVRWKEIELPENVVDQAAKGGFLDEPTPKSEPVRA